MKRLLFGAAALALPAIATMAGAAGAAEIVPPENSAAAQYTEAFPTGGGDKGTYAGRRKAHRDSPAKVLGSRNVKRLEAEGPAGHAVAVVASATAPAPQATAESESPTPAGPAGSHQQGGGGKPNSAHETAGTAPTEAKLESAAAAAEAPTGSSAFGEVVSQATGSSGSGSLGLLLPLAIVGAVLWAAAYAWRARRQVS